jgi:chromosome segregation ATPase
MTRPVSSVATDGEQQPPTKKVKTSSAETALPAASPCSNQSQLDLKQSELEMAQKAIQDLQNQITELNRDKSRLTEDAVRQLKSIESTQKEKEETVRVMKEYHDQLKKNREDKTADSERINALVLQLRQSDELRVSVQEHLRTLETRLESKEALIESNKTTIEKLNKQIESASRAMSVSEITPDTIEAAMQHAIFTVKPLLLESFQSMLTKASVASRSLGPTDEQAAIRAYQSNK